MCMSSKTPDPVTPAAAPAAPLPTPEEPEIGETRKKENREHFGQDKPNYRVRRKEGRTSMTNTGKIEM